jgi:YVTN family beta-propeller protein
MMRGLTLHTDPTRMYLFKLWTIISLWLFHRLTGSVRYRPRGRWLVTSTWVAVVCGALMVGNPLLQAIGFGGVGAVAAATLATPSRSTTIALTADETRLVVVNREANTVSIIRVKDAANNDVSVKLAEIGVGLEPRCVAVHPNDEVAYVTNGISATVSVVDLGLGRVVRNVPSGTEPRGCALTPNGNLLYVANHTAGTVSILDTSNPLNPILIPGSVPVGRNPTAIAITDREPATSPTTRSSSPRSSPSSTQTSSTPSSTVVVAEHVNLNQQIAVETAAPPPQSRPDVRQ